MEMVQKFLSKMYRTNPDFVFTVTRDFVRKVQTPVLILPDDIPAHPYAVAMEAAMLAPKADRLCQHCGDDSIGCPLQQVPDEGATNAETQRHELSDAQVIHHTELVIGK